MGLFVPDKAFKVHDLRCFHDGSVSQSSHTTGARATKPLTRNFKKHVTMQLEPRTSRQERIERNSPHWTLGLQNHACITPRDAITTYSS